MDFVSLSLSLSLQSKIVSFQLTYFSFPATTSSKQHRNKGRATAKGQRQYAQQAMNTQRLHHFQTISQLNCTI
jgi:hypothetical protein